MTNATTYGPNDTIEQARYAEERIHGYGCGCRECHNGECGMASHHHIGASPFLNANCADGCPDSTHTHLID